MNRISLRAIVVLASTSALAAGSLQVVALTAAHAAPAPVTSWESYPNSDSIEQGDGALDLVTSLNSSSGKVTSSTAPLVSSTAGTAVNTGFTVLLRNSDGTTDALPPNSTSQPLLSSVRVGLTPTTTVLEGSHGGLTLDLSETKPYEPSTAITQTAAEISNGPFMYFVLDVTNTTGSASSPSSVYLGMNGACGAVMNNFPSAGSVALPLCSSSDSGGTRYLVANTGGGVAAAVGTSLTSGFASTGAVSGSGSSGSAALSLQVPALSAGASWESTLVYGGWNTSAGIKPVSGSTMPFYYRQWWSSASSMLTFAQQNAASAISASASFDQNVTGIASDDASRYAASHAFRGWRHEQWLVAQGSTPHYYVIEGSFGYLSTLDVAYEYHPLQTQYEPWKSKLELDELAGAYETDSSGNKFLQHDVGQWNQLTAGAAYDLKGGTRKHMPVEHNLDFVAMAMLWEQATGQSYNHTLLQQLINGVESHDTNSDGEFDVTSLTACRPDGTCRTEPTGTTYDGSVSAAAANEQGNTILALKAGVVESIAAGDGLTAPGGGSLATVAQRHFTAVQPFINRQNSVSSLTGASSKPGYLPDAMLYAGALGSSPTIENNLSWIAPAVSSNYSSVLGSCTTCVARLSSSDTTTWISKALDGDVFSRWLAASHSSLAHDPLDLPKVAKIWVSRSGGLTSGTFESIAYKGETYVRGDYYPRAASIWAVLLASGSAPVTATIKGTITDSSSTPIAGATVQACPTAGVACGVSAISASDGSYTMNVSPGSFYVWASASGFQDTYTGGGHSPTDPSDSTVSATAGSTVTVNLALPASSGGGGTGTAVRINAGSTSSYTDSLGNIWASDRDFSGGTAYTAKSGTTVTGTPDPKLYLTQRYGAFSYSIPEAAGSYQVTLKFAEVAKSGVGTRVFSVQAEGATVLSNLDVFAEVGENVADDKTFTVPVTDGALTLNFVTGVQNPMVEGIQVVPAGSTPPPPVNGTVSGVVSSTSGPAISGATVSVCPSPGVACGVTTTTASNGSYSVSVPAGSYYVWAQASGFTDTYSGGGHSASDPADAPVTVASGGTTTESLSMPPVVTSFTPIFINAGSTKSYTDSVGNVWLSDRDFSGGKTFTAATTTITGTSDSTLYLTQRYGVFSYSIPVPNGTYQVTLKLAETWATAVGQRVFSVQAEGATVLSNLDLFAEVGANTVDDKTFTVTVSDGVLTLSSVANVQNPIFEGIEVQGT
jgi:Malectin domain/Carboxypeptidase regulatory-like domain/Glycosyl hydrolase family 52/Domain of unknown function (DUF4965)